MSIVTVYAKNGRVYRRKFDHEQAQIRHAAGETVTALAREYGVSFQAVKRVVDLRTRARMAEQTRRYLMSGVCVDCGKEGVSIHGPRCRACASQLKANSVRADTLRCTTCRRWLPDSDFPRRGANKARRQRHKQCRECNTVARRAYREKHKAACEGGCGRMVEGGGRAHRGNPDRPYLCRQCWLSRESA
jgi:hypothetical protein